jgi:hypothetical protein
MATTFDTLEFAERLKAGGFTEQQARAATEAFAKATGQELATKTDLDALRRDLKADVDMLRKDVEAYYWKVMAGVAAMLLVNLGVVWGIVATYAVRGR